MSLYQLHNTLLIGIENCDCCICRAILVYIANYICVELILLVLILYVEKLILN